MKERRNDVLHTAMAPGILEFCDSKISSMEDSVGAEKGKTRGETHRKSQTHPKKIQPLRRIPFNPSSTANPTCICSLQEGSDISWAFCYSQCKCSSCTAPQDGTTPLSPQMAPPLPAPPGIPAWTPSLGLLHPEPGGWGSWGVGLQDSPTQEPWEGCAGLQTPHVGLGGK